MIIRPTDVHDDYTTALAGVIHAARALGIECNCKLSSQWLVKIDEAQRTEARILALGCTNCGKRLVEFNPTRIVAGSVLILQVDEEPLSYCEECVNILFPEAI